MIPQTRQQLVSLFQASIDLVEPESIEDAAEFAVDRMEYVELELWRGTISKDDASEMLRAISDRLRAAYGGK